MEKRDWDQKWDNTAYIHCSNLDVIGYSLITLFGREGYYPVPKPSPRTPAQADSMQYGNADSNHLWAVAFLLGAKGWSVIKTAPFELLCERAPGATRPRLTYVASEIGCDTMQINLYDGTDVVLLEADSSGCIAISGVFGMADDDPFVWHDERISDEYYMARFRLIDIPNELQAVDYLGSCEINKLLDGDSLTDNSIMTQYLIPHKDIDLPGVRTLYFQST